MLPLTCAAVDGGLTCGFCTQPLSDVARMEQRLERYAGQIVSVERCPQCHRALCFWSTAGQGPVNHYPSSQSAQKRRVIIHEPPGPEWTLQPKRTVRQPDHVKYRHIFPEGEPK